MGRLLSLLIALLCLFQMVTVAAQENGYTYTVQPGDSWELVGQRVGLTVEELQKANPQAVRSSGWLIVGERLFIPGGPGWEEKFYIVKQGDGWMTVAEKFGLSVRLLQAANPRAQRQDNVLIVGERLLIPDILPSPTPAATSAPGSSPAPITPTPASAATDTPAAADLPTPPSQRIHAPSSPSGPFPPCPAMSADLGQALTAVFDTPTTDRYAQVTAFLAGCGAELNILVSADLSGNRADDAVIVYTIIDDERTAADGRQKLVLLGGGEAHSLRYTTTASGKIELLATKDINADNQTDVIWSDTICGTSTCFVTVHVRSWDGVAWQDWSKGTITMASANVSLTGGDEPGIPKDIRLTGGEYTGAGAGPQRAHTAVWSSTDGAPYTLSSESLSPSDCLYHTVLDANRAFADEHTENAQALYTAAVENMDLRACWERSNELSELRSFALFRLAVIAGYTADPALAAARAQRLESEYSEQIYTEVARRWLKAYQQTGDPRKACGVVNEFAAVTQSVVDVLADYGYANPTFSAHDVCPILSFTSRARLNPRLAQIDGLPECPQTAADYLSPLPVMVNLVSGDSLLIAAWLQACDAMRDDRGGLLIYDLNDDGLEDVIAIPTIIGDVGYGPGGEDGTIIILHKQEDGRYQNAYAPNMHGKPKLLAIGDVNADGRSELIWQLESCTTFCLLSVEVIAWDGTANTYRDVIEPGASIAEGTVIVEIADYERPTAVRRLRLTGGVSGTVEGGLSVPHTEIWYSIEGASFRRFSWMYDREREGNNCLGLRLIEADVALQTADVFGYAAAIELYTAALEASGLQPCSIYGTDPAEEMALLRGLASFRLVQILTLSHNRPTAESMLATLSHSQPQSKFTEAARIWLETYSANGDPAAACAAVRPIFISNSSLWQITGEFGYDHPALTVRQVCYVPKTESSGQ